MIGATSSNGTSPSGLKEFVYAVQTLDDVAKVTPPNPN